MRRKRESESSNNIKRSDNLDSRWEKKVGMRVVTLKENRLRKSIFRFTRGRHLFSFDMYTSGKVNNRIRGSRERYASKGRFIYDLAARLVRRHSKRQYLNIVKSCDTCQRQTGRSYLCSGSWPRIVLSIIDIASIMLNKRSWENKFQFRKKISGLSYNLSFRWIKIYTRHLL